MSVLEVDGLVTGGRPSAAGHLRDGVVLARSEVPTAASPRARQPQQPERLRTGRVGAGPHSTQGPCRTCPRLRIEGLLRPDDIGDGIRLALAPGEGYPIIYGETIGGDSVTLEACASAGGSEIYLQEPDRSVVILRAQRAWLGAHLPKPGATPFRQMGLSLGRLTDLSPVDEHARVGAESIELIDDSVSSRPGDIPGTERAELLVRAERSMPLNDWFDRYIRPMRALVALGADGAVAINRLTFEMPANVASFGGAVEMVEKRRAVDRVPDRRLTPHEILFNMSDLPGGFEAAMGRWLEVAARLRSILDLFVGPMLAPFMYEEHRFLNLAQAAEAYHRIVHGGTRLSSVEFDRRVTTVVDRCPSELQQWLRDSLAHSNSLASAARLRALLRARPWMEGEVIGRYGAFVQEVINTRNYHTHWDETGADQSARGLDLWPLSEQLAVLLQACLLAELGLTVDDAAKAIRRASGHYSAVRLNPSTFPGTTRRSS